MSEYSKEGRNWPARHNNDLLFYVFLFFDPNSGTTAAIYLEG